MSVPFVPDNPVHRLMRAAAGTAQVSAEEATGAERDRLWSVGLRNYPAWAAYERRAAPRRIPIVILTPHP